MATIKRLLLILVNGLFAMSYGVAQAQTVTVDGYNLSVITTSWDLGGTLLQSQPWFYNFNIAINLSIDLAATSSDFGLPNPSTAWLPFPPSWVGYPTSGMPAYVASNYPYSPFGVSAYNGTLNGANIGSSTLASFVIVTGSDSVGGGGGGAAVPEIDGALIPQVGLLLAGLFIILGRRKERTEPMLAA